MSKVFLDTNIFIYLIEDRGVLAKKAHELLSRMTLRRDQVFTAGSIFPSGIQLLSMIFFAVELDWIQ